MQVSALDHIVLNVTDVDRSLGFYCGHLGLPAERVDAWRRGEVRFPSVRVSDSTIIDLVGGQSEGTAGVTNLAHFCLVTDRSDLEGAARELVQAGVRIEEGPAVRSGARGNALSIYFRDPDNNLIELRTYANVGDHGLAGQPGLQAIQTAVDEAHARLRADLGALVDAESPLAGYDSWTKKDLIAHLTSIESRIHDQVRSAIGGAPWTPEDVDVFNARQVAARRGWSLDQLRQELDAQVDATRVLLGSLSDADLQRPFDHPRRGRITVEDLWRTIPNHVARHLKDLEET